LLRIEIRNSHKKNKKQKVALFQECQRLKFNRTGTGKLLYSNKLGKIK